VTLTFFEKVENTDAEIDAKYFKGVYPFWAIFGVFSIKAI
jgi:hypothetical protein